MDDPTHEPTHIRGIGAFGMTPEWLLLADISSTAKVLFAWMACKYANRSTWACWPGQTRLADDLSVSRGTIKHAIHELVGVGAIVKRTRRNEDGSPVSNYYQLMFLQTVRKLTHGQKTDLPLGQKTDPPLGQKTVPKPEVLELEVLEQEVQHAPAENRLTPKAPALVESPLQWHRRHGGHVQELCDWVCFPQELAGQFATRAKLADAEILAWARQVRREWEAAGKVPTGSMYDFWNARWSERNAQPTSDKAAVYAGLAASRKAREERDRLAAEKEERRRVRVRAELEAMERMRQEVWDEQQRKHGQ